MQRLKPPRQQPSPLLDWHRLFGAIPLHDHSRRLPPGVLAVSGRLTTTTWQGKTPALSEDALAIALRDGVDIRCRQGKSYDSTFRPGDIALVPRGTDVIQERTGMNEQLLLFFSPTLLGDVALQSADIDPARIELVERFAAPEPLVFAIGQAYLGALQEPGFAADLYLESLTHTLILHLLRGHAFFPPRSAAPAGELASQQVRDVRDYIHAHSDRNVTLAELATVVHLSPYYLTRLWKQTTGQPLHRYILAQRLAEGKRLLQTTDLPVAAIAAQLGFTDHSHFSYQFKREYGIPPSHLPRPRKNLHVVGKNLQDEPV